MGSDKIARAFVACSRWKWLPGMLGGDTGLRFDGDHPADWEAQYPDINDPATIGCIFQVVTEAHGRKALSFRPRPCGLFGVVVTVGDIGHGDEEQRFSAFAIGEALLLALQAAPEAP